MTHAKCVEVSERREHPLEARHLILATFSASERSAFEVAHAADLEERAGRVGRQHAAITQRGARQCADQMTRMKRAGGPADPSHRLGLPWLAHIPSQIGFGFGHEVSGSRGLVCTQPATLSNVFVGRKFTSVPSKPCITP